MSKDTFHLNNEDVEGLFTIVQKMQVRQEKAQQFLASNQYVQELSDIYQRLGEEVTPEVLEAAVEEYSSKMFTFEEPQPGMGRTLAGWYIKRGKIAKGIAVPVVAASALFGLFTLGKVIYQDHQESSVEEKVEAACQTQQELQARKNTISSSPLIKRLPTWESTQLTVLINSSENNLKQTTPFLEEYCINGSADDTVTIDNYERVEEQLTPVSKTLEEIAANLNKGQEMIGQVQKYDGLSAKVEPLYTEIKTVAKEPAVIQQTETLYAEAKAYTTIREVPKLERVVQKLEEMSGLLQLEYSVTVVSRKGEKSGIDRYYTDDQGKRSSGYYLIVEAKNPAGNALTVSIVNEENGIAERIAKWGERVPKEVYDNVARDKKDDGLIQDNILGNKERGFLAPRYEARFSVQGGRITHW